MKRATGEFLGAMAAGIRIVVAFVVIVGIVAVLAVCCMPLAGWTADTTATVVQTGFDLGRWLQTFKEVMEWVVTNQTLILTFIVTIITIIAALGQRRGKVIAKTAGVTVVQGVQKAKNEGLPASAIPDIMHDKGEEVPPKIKDEWKKWVAGMDPKNPSLPMILLDRFLHPKGK